jgi:hypothetical protein
VLDLLACDHAGRLTVVEVKGIGGSSPPSASSRLLDSSTLACATRRIPRGRLFSWQDSANLCSAPVAGRARVVSAPDDRWHSATFHAEVDVRSIGVAMDWRERIRVMFRKSSAARP